MNPYEAHVLKFQLLDKEKKKMQQAISKYLDFQESSSYVATNSTDRNMSIVDYMKDTEIAKI